MSPANTAKWTIICGVAFVFLYFGIEKFIHPEAWIGWLPSWIDGLAGLTKSTWLDIFGITEIALGILVIVPVRVIQKTGALLATVHLAGILTQVGWGDVAVRDSGLMCMTIALWYLL